MSTPGAGSGTLSGVERDGKRETGRRQTSETAVIEAAVLTVIAVTPPACARSDTGSGGDVSGSNSGASHQPSYGATAARNANVSGARHPSGVGSAPQFRGTGGRASR